jgi:hypothetical protein
VGYAMPTRQTELGERLREATRGYARLREAARGYMDCTGRRGGISPRERLREARRRARVGYADRFLNKCLNKTSSRSRQNFRKKKKKEVTWDVEIWVKTFTTNRKPPADTLLYT